jgi:hypothetical protein
MRDTEMATTLLVGSGSLGRNGFFDQREWKQHWLVPVIITQVVVHAVFLLTVDWFAHVAVREVEDDDRVSKFIIRNYGDGKQLSGRKASSTALKSKIQQEAEQEQSDKDSLFTQSQDHTSTSEAGTNSSLDEDSPRLKQRSSFKYTKLPPHSAPARSHQLPSPSSKTSPFLSFQLSSPWVLQKAFAELFTWQVQGVTKMEKLLRTSEKLQLSLRVPSFQVVETGPPTSQGYAKDSFCTKRDRA